MPNMLKICELAHKSIQLNTITTIKDVMTDDYDLLVFPDPDNTKGPNSKVVMAAHEYDAAQHSHLGKACTVLTPQDDDYLPALLMYAEGSIMC